MINTPGFTRVEDARRGTEPAVIARLPSGWVFMGDSQFLRGYSVLFADPKVGNLNALEGGARTQFLRDMALLGDAVQAVVGALRINYSMLGNVVPILHAHAFPRFEAEPENQRELAFWAFPEPERMTPAFELDRDAKLMQAINTKLRELGGEVAELDYPWMQKT